MVYFPQAHAEYHLARSMFNSPVAQRGAAKPDAVVISGPYLRQTPPKQLDRCGISLCSSHNGGTDLSLTNRCPQTILGFREYQRPGAVKNFICYLLGMAGKAMHELPSFLGTSTLS